MHGNLILMVKVSQSNMCEVMRSRDKEMKRADKSLFQDGQIGRNPHKLFNFKWNRFDNFSWIDASCIRGKNHFQASKYHKAGIRGRRTEVSGLENGWRRGQHQAVPPLLAGNQQIWHSLVRYSFCFTFQLHKIFIAGTRWDPQDQSTAKGFCVRYKELFKVSR